MTTRATQLILCLVAFFAMLILGGCRSVGDTPIATPETTAGAPQATPTSAPPPAQEPTAQPTPLPILLFGDRQDESVITAWSPGQAGRPIAHGSPLYGRPLSPDGRRMAIDAKPDDREPYPEVAILNLIDGSIETLHLLNEPRTVHWSPDGRYLLYVYRQESGDQLVLYDFASGDNTPVTSLMETILFAAGWSPDGSQIAFVGNDDWQYDLYVLDVVTRAVRRLTNTIAVETAAVWSPVENTLLVGADRYDERVLREGYQGVTTLHLINSGGRSQLPGYYDYITPLSLAWSSDGQQIAFSENGALCILDPATNQTTCPLEYTAPFGEYFAAFGAPPAWSPDDRWIAFRAAGFRDSNCEGVYALELETLEVVVIEEGRCETSPVYWVAD